MRKKVLFIHNSVAEYRIEFWKSLAENTELKLLVTNKELDRRIYGLEKDTQGLDISFFSWKKGFFENEWNVKNYDVVILPPSDTFKEFTIGLIFALLCKLYRKKCIYWTEHWEAAVKDQSLLRFCFNITKHIEIGILARLSNACIASGKKAVEFYKQIGIKDSKITTAIDSSTSPNISEVVDFEKTYGIPNTDDVVLYFGRIVERKGLGILLSAFQQMTEDNRWLLVCGDGPYLSNARLYVEENNIKHVVFAGKIQPSIRKAFYERANVFVLPSYPRKGSVEIWGLTVNESLEAGTPVVATNAVGAAFDLLNGRNGIMVNHSSAVELKSAIDTYIEKEIYTKDCRNTANKYSVSNMASDFIKCIDE